MLFLTPICGEILGSAFEFDTGPEFDPFVPLSIHKDSNGITDETILLTATIFGVLNGISHRESLIKWFNKYPHMSWGARFEEWCLDGGVGAGASYGSGCLARALFYAYKEPLLVNCLEEAKQAIVITHFHPESIMGVECFVSLLFEAKRGADKSYLKKLANQYYDLDSSWIPIERDRPEWESVMAVLPPAINAFLRNDTYDDVIKDALKNCRDTDSAAFVASSLLEAHGVYAPQYLQDQALALLPSDIVMVLEQFSSRYSNG
jgi:ADP-ribosylglycohydrolase